MATFVKLTRANKAAQTVWVNLDTVRRMERQPGHESSDMYSARPDRTVIWFSQDGPSVDDWDVVEVNEEPDQILALSDPENACPDPSNCGYSNYLAYRKDGETDLSHGGYHGAIRISEQHGATCKVYESGKVCPTCLRNEVRVRA